jgi:integrase
MMNKAEKWEWRADHTNPCRHIEKFQQHNRERYLSDAEYARLADAINSYDGSLYTTAAIRLLALTGCRRSEIMLLQWSSVDLDNGQLNLPDSKTGAKSIFLGEAAVALLRDLPRIHNHPFVFPGRVPGAPVAFINKAWEQIRAVAGLGDVRLHDLRHSFASMGVNHNLSLPIIGRLLGHSRSSTTERYAHLSANPLKVAAADIASRIDAAMHKSGQE